MIAIPLLVHNPLEFGKPLSWLSTAQRNYCGSFYNHGAILIHDTENIFGLGKTWIIVEAVKVGVQAITLEHYKTYSTNRILGTFTPEYEIDYDFIKSTVGLKYQYSIWWLEIVMNISNSVLGSDSKITQYFGNYNNPNRYYCFELLNDVFKSDLGYTCTGKDFEDKYEVTLFDINSIKL